MYKCRIGDNKEKISSCVKYILWIFEEVLRLL